MYTNYYSSSDVQLYLSNVDSTEIIKVDTALSIGYSVRQTAAPVYSLGSREIQFYSHGNTIGNGSLTIAFTDEEYLKYCLDHVMGFADPIIHLKENDSTNPDSTGLYEEDVQIIKGTHSSSRLIGNDKFRKDSTAGVNSPYDIQGSKALISIGAIRPLFDIKMFLNNETLVRSSDAKLMTLKGCKIIGENFSSSSTTDAPLMLSYNFIFKDIVRG